VGEATLLALEIIIRRANWSERITASVLRPLVLQLPVLATWWHWLVTSTKPGFKVQQEVSASAKLLPITLAGARRSDEPLVPLHMAASCPQPAHPSPCVRRTPQPLAAAQPPPRQPQRLTPRRRHRPTPCAGQIRERSLLRVLVQANLPPEVYGSEMVRAIVSVKWTSFARTFLLLQVIQYFTYFFFFLLYQVGWVCGLAPAPCGPLPSQKSASCSIQLCVRCRCVAHGARSSGTSRSGPGSPRP
jgi:hypothetical protein